jgi:glycosyltransferase involved in cell wall biosynthesis
VIPNKVFDALAVERPVVTADTPALREALIPGRHVWTCPAGDPQALAEAVAGLRADPGRRRSLAAAGRKILSGLKAVSAIPITATTCKPGLEIYALIHRLTIPTK